MKINDWKQSEPLEAARSDDVCNKMALETSNTFGEQQELVSQTKTLVFPQEKGKPEHPALM